jgi:uncharacterized membrane protein
MEKILDQIKKNMVSGIVLLLPILVFIAVFEKFWGFFQKYGDKFAKFLHLDKVLGTYATDLVGGAFLLLLIYLSGYLVSLAYLKAFSNWIDDKLMVFIPGYEKNKKLAEEKLNSKIKKAAPIYIPVLFKSGEDWQPAYLIEEDKEGRAVVFVPVAPTKEIGQIYITTLDQIQRLQETTIGSLNTTIKGLGKGALAFK